MLIYATILRKFIMYIICILIFHLTYNNPPAPAPSPLLMKDFDIFFAIRKTLFFPQSSSRSLPYESYKIIASEIFAFRSATYLENLVFSPATFRNSIFYYWSTGGGGGGIVYKMECLYRARVRSLRESHDGLFCNFSFHPLDIKFSAFCFL